MICPDCKIHTALVTCGDNTRRCYQCALVEKDDKDKKQAVRGMVDDK